MLKPKLTPTEEGDETTPSEETLAVAETRRRRKRQVNYSAEFGARTKRRQSYIRGRPSSSSTSPASSSSSSLYQPAYFDSVENPPFTAFKSNPYQDAYFFADYGGWINFDSRYAVYNLISVFGIKNREDILQRLTIWNSL